MTGWFVAYTQPRGELVAVDNLRRQGFDVYLPVFRKRRSHARRTDYVSAPLFPRYVFVALDPQAGEWRSVNSTRGVAHLVANGDRPLPMADAVMRAIRAREDDQGMVVMDAAPSFAPGQTLAIDSGPLAGTVGLFDSQSDQSRVTVLVHLLGRDMRLSLARDQVTALC